MSELKEVTEEESGLRRKVLEAICEIARAEDLTPQRIMLVALQVSTVGISTLFGSDYRQELDLMHHTLADYGQVLHDFTEGRPETYFRA